MDNDTTNNDMPMSDGAEEEVDAPAVEGEEVASEESSEGESFEDAE